MFLATKANSFEDYLLWVICQPHMVPKKAWEGHKKVCGSTCLAFNPKPQLFLSLA